MIVRKLLHFTARDHIRRHKKGGSEATAELSDTIRMPDHASLKLLQHNASMKDKTCMKAAKAVRLSIDKV